MGLLVQDAWNCSLRIIVGLLFLSIVIAVIVRNRPITAKFRWQHGHTLHLHITLVALGMFFYGLGEEQQHPLWLGKHWRLHDHLIVRIDDVFLEKTKTFQTIGVVEKIARNNISIPVKGSILLYFKKGTYIKNLHFGDRLELNVTPELIKNSGNPGAFAVADYYARQHIFHQVFMDRQHILRLKRPLHPPWQVHLIQTREWIVLQLHRFLSAQAAGLAAAMLIGYKDALDPFLYQSYVNTGVVHVIAISGMHLGLIYTILRMLTQWLPQRWGGRLMRSGMQLSGIWIFTFLTGAGPSILRAAVMFSCLIIGEIKNKRPASLNTLSAAAFILLCFRPQWLWDVGFLLSFIALGGIFLLQSPIYGLFPNLPRLIDSLWKFNSVTLAAQLITTPVSLYFFHQFPLYFLCSNLIAVPLSTAILLLSIAICITSPSVWFAGLIGKLTEWIICILNKILAVMAGWPNALLVGWQLEHWEVALWYVWICLLYLFVRTSIRFWRIAAMACTMLLIIMHGWVIFQANDQHRIIVYQVKKQTAFAWIKGRHCLFLTQPSLLHDSSMMECTITPTNRYYHIRQSVTQLWQGETCIVEYAGGRICIAGRLAAGYLRKPISVLVITRYTSLDLMKTIDPSRLQQLICDPSVSIKNQTLWESYAQKKHIPFFSIDQRGAFVKRLP